MSLEKAPIDSSSEKKELVEIQEQIVEKVKRARKKAEKKPETETPEIQTSETPTEPEATEISIEPETKKSVSLEELANMVKKIQGISDEEARELVQKRIDLIKKHNETMVGASMDLEDIDNDIWVLTIEKGENDTNEDYEAKRHDKDIATLSDAVKRGILTLKEFNDYKTAKQGIEKAEKNGADQKQLEEIKILLEEKENEFAERITKYMFEQHDEREALRKKIRNDLSSRTGHIEKSINDIDEKITEDPEKVEDKKGLMKGLVDSVRKIWLGKDGILGEESKGGVYKKWETDSKNEKAVIEEKREKERTKERDSFLTDLKITIENISKNHDQIKSNLQKVLNDERFKELLEIMASTKFDVKSSDFEKINAIRKEIVENILISDEPVLKNATFIVPWAKTDSGYSNDMSYISNPEVHEIINFYKNETTDEEPAKAELVDSENKVSKLQGENTIFKVLIGKKETSEIRQAFEDRKYADKSGKFKELKAEYLKHKEDIKKQEQKRQQNAESKKQEKAEIEKMIHEALNDDFIGFEIPVYDGKKITERHPVAIKFETYVSEKKTIMLKVVEIIDKKAKNKDTIKPKEVDGLPLGRTFDLETLSGAPQWIKDGLNDDAKERLVNALVIKENQK